MDREFQELKAKCLSATSSDILEAMRDGDLNARKVTKSLDLRP